MATIPKGKQALRGFLGRHRITVREVARATCTSDSYVAGLLTGYRRCKPEAIERIRGAIGQIMAERSESQKKEA